MVFNVILRYPGERVQPYVGVGGGLRHVGSSYVNTANTIRIPSYAVVDGLAEYAVNTHLSLRLNVNNLTNETYVRNVNNNGGRYNPGYSRSALLTSISHDLKTPLASVLGAAGALRDLAGLSEAERNELLGSHLVGSKWVELKGSRHDSFQNFEGLNP